MAGWYELKKSSDNKHYFTLKAGNGEIILTSEMYEARVSAEKGIRSVQENCSLEERYERKEAGNGKFHFNLKAANHQIIGVSQMYANEQTRDKGIVSVQTNGQSSTIKDLTTA